MHPPAKQDAQREATEAAQGLPSPPEVLPRVRMSKVHLGDALPDLAFFWILASAIVKITYKRQIQAEVKAAQATETAEAESLKRQVVEDADRANGEQLQSLGAGGRGPAGRRPALVWTSYWER
mgnify:CR=1 FL=1